MTDQNSPEVWKCTDHASKLSRKQFATVRLGGRIFPQRPQRKVGVVYKGGNEVTSIADFGKRGGGGGGGGGGLGCAS